MPPLEEVFKRLLRDPLLFTRHLSGITLRRYQEQVARALVASIRQGLGLTFVVVFPRQSGKNELQAQIQTYLLTMLQNVDAEIVQVSPTWKPQSQNAMRRLRRVLERNLLTRDGFQTESGYIYRLGKARVIFLSGSPTANVVGATANVLLSCDEAQDVLPGKWDKDFAPMAASTNATKVFWGTMWTANTLLARELRAARQAQAQDGIRRVFVLDAGQVAAEVPAYGKHVAGQVRRLGRQHPMVRSQYFSEEIDAQGGMFSAERLALMQGGHAAQTAPQAGALYALTLDVAGEDEAANSGVQEMANPGRDATALTVLQVDLAPLSDPLVGAPLYRVVGRQQWLGVKHASLYAHLKALIEHWEARFVVADATGVGAGLVSFLSRAYPERVLPFIFNRKSKSQLGWDFLAVVESGRYKEYQPADELQRLFWAQARRCQMEVLSGPARNLRWGVPQGARNSDDGALLHDDLLISAALCAQLDAQHWGVADSAVIPAPDPLAQMDEIY